MKHTLRITILVVLFCAAAVQSWANPTITKGYIYGGTVKIYAEDPTTNTSQSEIADAAAGNTVYLVAEADYQHISAGIDWRVMKSGSSSVAQSRTRSVGYAKEITVTNVAGNVYSFTMPTGGERVTVSATFAGKPTAQTTYIDPTKSAGQQECSATAYILDGTEQEIGANGKTTWYVCNSTVTYSSSISLYGDVHLILADGKTMKVTGPSDGSAILGNNDASLAIYGQSLGTGKLEANADIYCISIPGTFTLNGGQVTANGGYGLYIGNAITINGGELKTNGSWVSIECVNDFTFNGGKVAAIGGNSYSIHSNLGNIVLGWSNPDDYIYASSYYCNKGQVKTAEGKRFVAYKPTKSPYIEGFNPYETITKATAIVSGTSGEDTFMYPDLIGNMLRPIDGNLVTVAGGISLMDGTTAKTPDFSITTGAGTESVVTTPYYLFKASTEETPVTLTLSYSGTDFAKLSDLPEGTTLNRVDGKPMQRSFAMPAEDVALTTTAVDVSKFTLSPSEFICDGTAKTPSVMNGESVFDAANYTMAFKDGDDASIIITEAKKVGDYNVILTGCGQYLGTATLTNAFSIKTCVKFSVVDVADGKELAGAHVQVIDSEGIVVKEWTSGTEEHEVVGLDAGVEYTLRETVAPNGYTIPADITFSIDKEGKVTTNGSMTQDGVLLVENSKTKVEISVVDVADGEELEGATVQVIDSEGDVAEEWTSGTDIHVIEGLKTGEEYTLKETVARDGYTIPDDFTFTIDETGKITTTGTITEDGVLLVENSKTKVKVCVTDIAAGRALAGATVQVIDSEGDVAEEWTSTAESNVIEGLKTGEEYTLCETVAPDGYIISTDITFTIDETGKITTTGTKTEDGVLLVENTKTHVEISVVDKDSGAPLVGPTVQAIDSEGKVVEACITSEGNPVNIIDGLKTGVEYTLHETNAPEGYVAPADYTFTIAIDGQVTSTGTITESGVLLVENSKTHVEFSVVDKVTRAALKGATVQVLDSEWNVVDAWTSTDESHVIEGLKTGEEYTLRETVVPTGYAIPADITFTIDNAGQVTTTDGTTTTDEEGNTVLLVENPFTVPLFAAGATNLWMTWCDKYEYVKPEGVTVYTVSGVENNTVTLGEVSDVIPAYTPVLIYRAAAGTAAVTAVFSSLGTGTDGIQTAEATGCTFYGNSGSELFKDEGTTKYIFPLGTANATEQSYILRGGSFIPVDDLTGGIPAHRCWLNVSKDALAQSGNSNARSLSIIMDDGEKTGMTPPLTPPLEGAGSDGGYNAGAGWYTIDGRRLTKAPTQKGIYIHNGKKTVIK